MKLFPLKIHSLHTLNLFPHQNTHSMQRLYFALIFSRFVGLPGRVSWFLAADTFSKIVQVFKLIVGNCDLFKSLHEQGS